MDSSTQTSANNQHLPEWVMNGCQHSSCQAMCSTCVAGKLTLA